MIKRGAEGRGKLNTDFARTIIMLHNNVKTIYC